jgi:hypothetical protein
LTVCACIVYWTWIDLQFEWSWIEIYANASTTITNWRISVCRACSEREISSSFSLTLSFDLEKVGLKSKSICCQQESSKSLVWPPKRVPKSPKILSPSYQASKCDNHTWFETSMFIDVNKNRENTENRNISI